MLFAVNVSFQKEIWLHEIRTEKCNRISCVLLADQIDKFEPIDAATSCVARVGVHLPDIMITSGDKELYDS